VTIRRAQVTDAPVVANLLGELGYTTAPELVVQRLRALGDGDVVLLAGEDAGLIALHRINLLAEGGALARITALVVAESRRRQGVARELLSAAERIARSWRCDLLEVSSGRRAEREAAHGFYLRAGFKAGDRSVRYWKTLSSTDDASRQRASRAADDRRDALP
jgi:GNAT superfamily N-acetyltransferase